MKILVADDESTILTTFGSFVESMGHEVLLAGDGKEAWEIWQREKPGIVVTDWIMPGMDGIELSRKIRDTGYEHYTYIIVVSAKNTKQNVVQGLAGGIDDYITKPVHFLEFKARIEIGERVVNLESELTRRYQEIKTNYFQTIRMFTNLIEVYDETLGGHCRRVADLALRILDKYGQVDPKDRRRLETAALLHDIGLVGLPNKIFLKKTTEMKGDEKKMYERHPVHGEMILSEIEFLKPVAKIVRSHHEQYNGRGFPDGLSGDDIPFFSQIIAGASFFDDIIEKNGIPLKKAPDKIRIDNGYRLYPWISDILLEITEEKIREEESNRFSEIDLPALSEGMVLAADIRVKRGALLMPGDTRLTEYGIEKLKSYHELGCIPGSVFIKRKK